MGRLGRYYRSRKKKVKDTAYNVGSIAGQTVDTGLKHAKSYADTGAALVGGAADIVGDTALTVGDIALGPLDEIALAGAGAMGVAAGKGASAAYDLAEVGRDLKGATLMVGAGVVGNEDLADYGRHLMDTKGYAQQQKLVDTKTQELEGWLNKVTQEALSHGGATKKISQSEWSDLKKRNKERARIAIAKAEGERAIMKGDAQIYHQYMKETNLGMSDQERREAINMKKIREKELRDDHPQADVNDYLSAALLAGGVGGGIVKGGKMGGLQGAITGVSPALLKVKQHQAIDKAARDAHKQGSRWYDRYLR